VSRLLVGAGLVVVLVLSGCGSVKPVKVSGKLVLPAGVKLVDTDSVMVYFTPENDPTATGGAATVNPTSLTFETTVPAGKYKVGVTAQAYPGMKESPQREKELSQRFGTFGVTTTALHYEVTKDANQSITIDLPQGMVKKN